MAALNSWPVRGLLGVLVLALAAGAAWWFFIRSDNELATAPLGFVETPSAETGGTATPVADAEPTATRDVDGAGASEGYELFVIVPEHPSVDGRAEAAYFADEQLASLAVPSTAKGTTFDVSGQFSLGPDGLDPAVPATIEVGLSTLRSDEGRRDSRVADALQVAQFPTATFTATAIEGWPGAIADGETITATLTGLMNLKGVERELKWDVQATRSGDVVTALATTNFLYEDFGIPVLNIGGFVSVEEDVTLQVQLIAEKAG